MSMTPEKEALMADDACTCELNGQDDPDCEKHHPEVREMVMTVAAGHAEYGNSNGRPIIDVLWAPNSDDDIIWNGAGDPPDQDEAAKMFAAKHPDVVAPAHCDLSWEEIWQVYGTAEEILAWYDELVRDLAVTPSGDDTVYDYWPSGVRLARQVAVLLPPTSPERLFVLGMEIGRVIDALGLRPDDLNL